MVSNNKKHDHRFNPQQIHLAIGDDILQIVISWSTRSDPKESIVMYGEKFGMYGRGGKCSNMRMATGMRKVLDSQGVIQYIHFVTLKHLLPETLYCYYVGSHKQWSKTYEFLSFPKHNQWSPNIALYGDMGVDNGRALKSIINKTEKGFIDAVIHIGDIGYNLYAFNGLMGDKFMNIIQPFATRVPFMVIPGNHEYLCYEPRCPSDFGVSYETRFKMPNSKDNNYYTFNLGPALFIGINTEVYFEEEMSDWDLAQKQYNWLKNILKRANKPENRRRHPWIIVYGHRPIYCTSAAECLGGVNVLTRNGYEIGGNLHDIEELLYEYGVDLAFWGHQHYYERSYPVFNQTAFVNSMYHDTFANPRATVHILSGAAGMHSGMDELGEAALWTAFRARAYSYTRFRIINETHLYLEQLDVDQNDKVMDRIWIIQENHMPFPMKNRNLVSDD